MLIPRSRQGDRDSDYTKFGSNPGGGRPTFTRCRKILRTSSGSVITARVRRGEPHHTRHLRPLAL